MRVQYIKDLPDESVAPGFVFLKGWTAEHTDAEGQARIDSGHCTQVGDNTRARRSEILTTECATPEQDLKTNKK